MQVEEKLWAETMNPVLYVTNTVSCAAYKFRTPFEVCFGRKPSVAHFKVFGAQGYPLIDNPRDPNSSEKLTNDAHAGEDDVNTDINTEMEIVPAGRLDGFTGSPTFAPSGPNHHFESEPSHSITPYEFSDAIVPVDIEETRPQKRFRIEQEQANAALDLPST
uniref:AlNc14C31G2899 protein n=1 Tax=Albugo laibachii Nc14 TaxID=890382 RepID=F0W7U9_9STRA|nr:AlNc14C31G2899 [Albugo laibachii Nc14]|eukprot:CCA17201.1 AlNc14C31G2899 [Albugo laibachii Nc14]